VGVIVREVSELAGPTDGCRGAGEAVEVREVEGGRHGAAGRASLRPLWCSLDILRVDAMLQTRYPTRPQSKLQRPQSAFGTLARASGQSIQQQHSHGQRLIKPTRTSAYLTRSRRHALVKRACTLLISNDVLMPFGSTTSFCLRPSKLRAPSTQAAASLRTIANAMLWPSRAASTNNQSLRHSHEHLDPPIVLISH